MTVTNQIAAKAKVGEEAQALLNDEISPSAYLDLLTKKESVQGCGAVLRPRGARGFGRAMGGSVRQGVSPQTNKPPKGAASLAAAEKWLGTRSEDDRWAARRAADKSGMSSAGDCVAMAVFFAGKSMTPPDAPVTPPPPFASNKMSAGAVQIAVASGEPGKSKENYQRALAIGKEITVSAAKRS